MSRYTCVVTCLAVRGLKRLSEHHENRQDASSVDWRFWQWRCGICLSVRPSVCLSLSVCIRAKVSLSGAISRASLFSMYVRMREEIKGPVIGRVCGPPRSCLEVITWWAAELVWMLLLPVRLLSIITHILHASTAVSVYRPPTTERSYLTRRPSDRENSNNNNNNTIGLSPSNF